MPRLARSLGLAFVVAALALMSAWVVPAAAGVLTDVGERWGPTDLVLFWGDGCPHCADEKEWLDEVSSDHPEITVHELEVWFDEENRQVLLEVAAEMGFEASGVPVTILGDRHWIGWSDVVADELATEIETVASAARGESAGDADPATETSGAGTTIEVPIVGEVTLGESLVASTLLIGFVDGMNPCSLWVITVLLAIVVRTGARGRVVAIGTTYLLVTAVMYGLFILGIYSALTLVSHLGVVQLVVALVAGALGVLSVKDYVAYGTGPSTSISDSAKPGLYHRMRDAAGHEALLPALAATVVLAVGVSFIEIPCTAGFPLLWAGLLQANDVGLAQGAALLVLFMIPYLLDEMIVFAVAVITMRSLKMQERHGRVLKLVAGTMMIALALTVVLAPQAMATPVVAVLIFAAAMATAALIHLVLRTARPELFDRGTSQRRERQRIR